MFFAFSLLAVLTGQTSCAPPEQQWFPVSPQALRVEDGTAFAWVSGSTCAVPPTARVDFQEDGGTSVEVWQHGVRLTVRVVDFDVFAAQPIDFGLGFTASSSTPLRVTSFDGAGLAVEPQLPDDVVRLQPWSRRTLACDDVRTAPRDLNAVERWEAELGPATTVLSKPRGEKRFILRAGGRARVKRVLRGFSRVDVVLPGGAGIDGWVAAELRPTTSASHIVGSSICCPAFEPLPRLCDTPLQLVATDGARASVVGSLQADHFFEVLPGAGAWVRIIPRERFFTMAPGWSLAVDRRALEACSAKTALRAP